MPIFYTDSGSFNDISVTGSLSVSGSLLLTSTQAFAPSIISASQITASNGIVTYGPLQIISSSGITTYQPNSAYWYVSGSDIDLWYKHKSTSQVKMDWFEGVLETGLIYGGIRGFSGSQVYINAGEGIIVNHGATTSSVTSPTVTYVKWPILTASIDVTNGFVTYLSISNTGTIVSQSTKFTPTQYHDQLPLGAVGHFNQQAIAAKGDQVNTQHSPIAQLADFSRNFGPIKVSGYGITAQSGSLKFSRASGDAFIYGGFYTVNPETPSNYQSTSVNTGSIAYVYRTGSVQGYAIDANNNNFYTDVKPGFYDIGGATGTASLAANEWSIQRVFIEPVTGIHYIYYGQTKYTSLANAVSNITTDTFAEGPVTTLFTVFAGYLIMKGDTTNLADTGSNNVISAGLFRNTSAGSVGGGAAAQNLNDLSDVIVTSAINGQSLIYSSGNWVNGNPTSASFATTASFASTAPYSGLTGLPTLVSASSQIDYNSIQNKLSGVVSSSAQVAPLLPGGTVSSSAQYPGWVTASSQIDYNSIQNKLSGVVSSSAQFTSLTAPFTGSFTGSHIGTVTASALQILNTTDTAATNKVLVLNTATNQVFTTASVGGGGGTGTVGPGTVNSIALFNASSTISSSNIFQSTNNIGIGTTAPVARLSVVDTGNVQSSIAGTNAAAYTQLLLSGSGRAFGVGVGNASETTYGVANELFIFDHNAGAMRIAVDSSGFVGINKTALSYQLDVSGSAQVGENNASSHTPLRLQTSDGTLLFRWDAPVSTTRTWNIVDNPGAFELSRITGQRDLAVGTSYLAFSTATGYSIGERLRINPTGNVGIGTTAPGVKLEVNGEISASAFISGSLLNIREMSMLVSGTVAAPGGTTVTLNLNNANYFAVSASGTGTVTWVVTNPPPAGRSQTFLVEYTNGGVVTNSWFTGTKWSGGVAPTLTAGANPDLLGFITDDAGTNWRGVLLQRNSS